MEPLTLFLFALGLSVDSFAVSVTSGLSIQGIRFQQAVRIAFTLAVFQGGIMLIGGWAIGYHFRNSLDQWDHWIAFALLSFVAGKMILESLKKEENKKPFNPLRIYVLLTLAIATSIDSLVVGLSFAFLEIHIIWAAFVIGTVTFLVSMIGLFFGKKIGERFSHRMELIGGIVLFAIGAKILIQHFQSLS